MELGDDIISKVNKILTDEVEELRKEKTILKRELEDIRNLILKSIPQIESVPQIKEKILCKECHMDKNDPDFICMYEKCPIKN